MMDVLRYTPVTDQDFGTLSCWGVNEVGMQQNPCLFQVVLAGELLPTTFRGQRREMQNNHVETRVLDMFVELLRIPRGVEQWSDCGQTNIGNEECAP